MLYFAIFFTYVVNKLNKGTFTYATDKNVVFNLQTNWNY